MKKLLLSLILTSFVIQTDCNPGAYCTKDSDCTRDEVCNVLDTCVTTKNKVGEVLDDILSI